MPVLVAPDGNVVKVYPNPGGGLCPRRRRLGLRPPAEKLHQILPGGVANLSDERAVGCDQRSVYARDAAATFRRDRRINIRISTRDLDAIQKRALEEGLPYQTLIASVLHKYATGRL